MNYPTRTLTTALAVLLLLADSAATQKLNTPTFSPAQITYEKFAGGVDGTKQARGQKKDLKPLPGDTRDKACRSDEIREYLLRRGIIPPSKKLQARLLAGSTPEVRVIYLIPSDRQPRAEAPTALANGIKHLQRWYWEQLGNGKTFKLHEPIVENKRSTHETSWFSTNPAGDNPSLYLWFNSINDASATFFDPSYIYVIYVDVEAPGQAVGGAGGVALLPQHDILGMIGQNANEPNVCRWVGGLGHELGHALGLPHPPECDSHQSPDNSFPCQSLMYLGYSIYPVTYLLSDNKASLNQNSFIVSFQLNTAPFGCSNLLSVLIESVIPRVGGVAGNQQIKLTGSFAGLSSVTMGGAFASWSYTNGANDTSAITVTTPAHAIGAVSISLIPISGSSYSTLNAFAFLPTTFTDNTIVAGITTVKAQHILELRQAVDALRAVAGIAPFSWTDATLTPSVTVIKALHIRELRTYLDDAATRLGYSTASYTDPSLNTGFLINLAYIEELRQRIRAIAG
jgi:hypothetical protein